MGFHKMIEKIDHLMRLYSEEGRKLNNICADNVYPFSLESILKQIPAHTMKTDYTLPDLSTKLTEISGKLS